MLPYRQYTIVVDGSRRITLRICRFFRKTQPVKRKNDFAPDFDVPDIPLVRETFEPSELGIVTMPTIQHDLNIAVPPPVSSNENTANKCSYSPHSNRHASSTFMVIYMTNSRTKILQCKNAWQYSQFILEVSLCPTRGRSEHAQM